MSATFFKPNLKTIKPYALMDLDDTLFQTLRKIEAWALPTSDPDRLLCATVNKQGEPLSYMSVRQANFFNWLHISTELIVVTARDTVEIKRVKLPFNSWRILTHGAVIVKPDGDKLEAWQAKMAAVLHPLQAKMQTLIDAIVAYNTAHNVPFKLAIHTDNFDEVNFDEGGVDGTSATKPNSLVIYIAIKHRQKDHQSLVEFATKLPTLVAYLEEDFYIHINANNLAILPHGIHKRHATQFLLAHYLDKERPSFGFGDSLADLTYLQQLDWYGTPNHGQLHDKITGASTH